MQLYILAGISIVLMGWYATYNYMDSQINKLEKELIASSSNEMLCNEALDTQSKSIEALALDYEDRINTYENLISTQEPELRYKYIKEVIYKDVNSSVKERSCEEAKQIQNNTYNSDWNKF